ncbi:HEAT repeat domain-containing protein [Actinoplanes nipponensis]|uniref:HEAT repeat domain-containing protein n=1 Tax=Actinoplanes nipponensis TaxID=135950 RepID=UPI0019415E9F|nr:HEAT repeat domain-containing protein [Actinoplanes nipponensis]
MTDLVHLTPQHSARRVARTGIAARSRGWFGDRGVFCMPVLPSFTLTHQWVRELRRWHPGVLAAVQLRLPGDEPVTVGRYGVPPQRLTAARAAALVRELADPRGYEVFVPRAVTAAEIRHVRSIPQGVGWRYLPGAHGTRPCACPRCLAAGTPGAAKIRRRFSPDGPAPTKPELMAALRAATTSEEIIEALWMLGGRRRGGAEELAYLAVHPDPEVREALAELLGNYRGRAARELRRTLDPQSDETPGR